MRLAFVFTALVVASASVSAGGRLGGRPKVIVDQDCSGPGTTNTASVGLIAMSDAVDVLGVTVPTGDAWRDEEVAHCLRLLEIIGKEHIPVIPGAVFPFVRTRDETLMWQRMHGKLQWLGAWNVNNYHGPYEIPPMIEGTPRTKALNTTAAQFMVDMVNRYPGEVTIISLAPLTNIATAMVLDPHFAEKAKELVMMAGSFNPQDGHIEHSNNPRHELNFFFDPDAARKVLRGAWNRVQLTPADVAFTVEWSEDLVQQISLLKSPMAGYIEKYTTKTEMVIGLCDESTVLQFLDPSITTSTKELYVSVDTGNGPSQGNTLSWIDGTNPSLGERKVQVVTGVDKARLYTFMLGLLQP